MGVLDPAIGARIIASGGRAAVLQPQRQGERALVRPNRHLLVIAAQTDVCAGLRLLSAHQQLDNASAVRPAIDVVTEKDIAGWSPGRVGLTRPEQALQHVEAAVNIANRKGER
jgi:predicted GNAT family N-acyltransferase